MDKVFRFAVIQGLFFVVMCLCTNGVLSGSEYGQPLFQQPAQALEGNFLPGDNPDAEFISKYLDAHTTFIDTRVADSLTGNHDNEKEIVLRSPEGVTVNESSLDCILPTNEIVNWNVKYSARTKVMTYTFGSNTLSVRVVNPISEIFIRARGVEDGIFVSPDKFNDAYRGRSTFASDLSAGDPVELYNHDYYINILPGASPGKVKIIRLSLEHITDEFELSGSANFRINRNAQPSSQPRCSEMSFQIILNCNTPAIEKPPGGAVAFDHWSADYEISDDAGIVLRNVKQREVSLTVQGKGIFVPFGDIKTAQRPTPSRYHLVPNGPTGDFESCRLIKFKEFDSGDSHILRATYHLENSHECIRVTEWFVFEQEYDPWISPTKVAYPSERAGRETGPFPNYYRTAKLAPIVYYEYYSNNNDSIAGALQKMEIPIELTWDMTTASSLFDAVKDPNTKLEAIAAVASIVLFPLTAGIQTLSTAPFRLVGDSAGYRFETRIDAIKSGQIVFWDNYHYTSKSAAMDIPWLNPPGCPDCVHMHWRWGDFLRWPNGNVLIPKSSNQDVYLLPLKQNPTRNYPSDMTTAANPTTVVDGVPQSLIYLGRGHNQFDNFLIHGIVFNGPGQYIAEHN